MQQGLIRNVLYGDSGWYLHVLNCTVIPVPPLNMRNVTSYGNFGLVVLVRALLVLPASSVTGEYFRAMLWRERIFKAKFGALI